MDTSQNTSLPSVFFITSLATVKPDCDAFGKPHCSYNRWSAWSYFALGLLLMFTNARNLVVLVYILRRHWVGTNAVCSVISGLNAIFGALIVVRSATITLRDLWPSNQFVVHIWFCLLVASNDNSLYLIKVFSQKFYL